MDNNFCWISNGQECYQSRFRRSKISLSIDQIAKQSLNKEVWIRWVTKRAVLNTPLQMVTVGCDRSVWSSQRWLTGVQGHRASQDKVNVQIWVTAVLLDNRIHKCVRIMEKWSATDNVEQAEVSWALSQTTDGCLCDCWPVCGCGLLLLLCRAALLACLKSVMWDLRLLLVLSRPTDQWTGNGPLSVQLGNTKQTFGKWWHRL